MGVIRGLDILPDYGLPNPGYAGFLMGRWNEMLVGSFIVPWENASSCRMPLFFML